MVLFLDKIIDLFRKKNKDKTKEAFEKKKCVLEYSGDEPDCMACQYPIHDAERKKKINGNVMHRRCFKTIKRMIVRGQSVDGFNKL